ncbi:MAG: LytTR family transcriptional regulator [Erysipelotrichaceae bacterium]|nr:LytTR family transcriptional regulator [Erysipelotrichaceae bacterium]
MIRVAFLEYEKETKELAFRLSKVFSETDWTFRHFSRASDLAKAMQETRFHLFVFDEMFKTTRFESVFIHDNPNALFIFTCKDVKQVRQSDRRNRVLYISRDNLLEDFEAIEPFIKEQCKQVDDVYSLVYDGVDVNLQYEDIYYLEKMNKMVYFHTKKGEFHKRANMSDLEKVFAPYGFSRVHVSYLVNDKHIQAWYTDMVQLDDGTKIPMSRSQRRKLMAKRKQIMPDF